MKQTEKFNFVFCDKNTSKKYRINTPSKIFIILYNNFLGALAAFTICELICSFILQNLIYIDADIIFSVLISAFVFIVLCVLNIYYKNKKAVILTEKGVKIIFGNFDISTKHLFTKLIPFNKIVDICDYTDFTYCADVLSGAYDQYHIAIKTRHNLYILPIEEGEMLIAAVKEKTDSKK